MITVIENNLTRLIPVNGTLLESLERSNISVESHCRDGFCGACKIGIKKGSVDYITDPLGFVDDDEVLACCSIPNGAVEIEVR